MKDVIRFESSAAEASTYMHWIVRPIISHKAATDAICPSCWIIYSPKPLRSLSPCCNSEMEMLPSEHTFYSYPKSDWFRAASVKTRHFYSFTGIGRDCNTIEMFSHSLMSEKSGYRFHILFPDDPFVWNGVFRFQEDCAMSDPDRGRFDMENYNGWKGMRFKITRTCMARRDLFDFLIPPVSRTPDYMTWTCLNLPEYEPELEMRRISDDGHYIIKRTNGMKTYAMKRGGMWFAGLSPQLVDEIYAEYILRKMGVSGASITVTQ